MQSSQCKRISRLVFGLVVSILAQPGVARAAGGGSPFASEPSPSEPLPPSLAPAQGTPPLGVAPLPQPPPPRAAPVPAEALAGAPSAPPPAQRAPRPGTPGSDLPAPPRQALGVHLHDGFYLRMGLGLAYSGALVSSDSKNIGDYSFAAIGDALDLWIGGTPTPGLALGGALSAFGFTSSKRSVSGSSVSGTVTGSTGLVGVFVDGFPDPEGGFHFGGALGVASGAAEIKDTGNKFAGGGLGLEGWAGYDFWASEQWSLGGALRFMGSITRQDTDTAKYASSIGGVSLSFTALYH